MVETSSVGAQLGAAVHQNAPLSRTGLLERLFARLFEGLVYAQIWEDPVADMQALDLGPEDDMVCIASGGCNVMSYLVAGPRSIAAVDLSPALVALLKLKLAAARTLPEHRDYYDLFGHADRPGNLRLYDETLAPVLDSATRAFWEGREMGRRRVTMLARNLYRFGVLGRFIAAAHLLSRIGGVDYRPFLAARSLDEQRAFYETRVSPLFDRPAVRWLARRRASLFGLGIPPAQYDKLAADGDGDIIPVLRERVRKLMCDFPLASNYFAWAAFNRGYPEDGHAVPPYLEARAYPDIRARCDRVRVHNRSVTALLAQTPARSKSVYVLLDAQDWMTDAQLTELWSEITRTARPGARVLFRTGGTQDILPGRVPPEILEQWAHDDAASARASAADRSAIYGAVHLYRFAGC